MSSFQDTVQSLIQDWPLSLIDPNMQSCIQTRDKKTVQMLVNDKLSLIPKRYKKSLWDLTLTPSVQIALKLWFSNHTKWLYFHGAVGCGKTTLLTSLFIELGRRMVDVYMINAGQLESLIKSGISDNTEQHKIKKVKDVGILIIDDLGVERLSEYNLDWIYEIIDHRQSHEMTTIIASNLALEELHHHYATINPLNARRIISRIRESSLPVEFENASYR